MPNKPQPIDPGKVTVHFHVPDTVKVESVSKDNWKGKTGKWISEFIKIGLSAGLGFYAAVYGYNQNKQTDLETQYLIDAYVDINTAFTLMNDHQRIKAFDFVNKATTSIELFGSQEQVRKSHLMVKSFELPGSSGEEIIKDLRTDLRKRLNLSELTGEEDEVRHFIPSVKHQDTVSFMFRK